MALSFNNISPVGATLLLGNGSSGSGRAGSSFASAITSQFTARQATLVLNRATSKQRVFVFQRLEYETAALERKARSVLSFDDARSPLAEREVVVADSAALSGTAKAFASARTFAVQIDQLAAAQVVRSDTLTADDAQTFGSKKAKFELTVGSDEFKFQVDLGEQTTNQDVLEAVAAEINAAKSSGVFAEVVRDETTGEILLQTSAHSTGTDSAFTLEDTSRSLLEDIGLSTDQGADVAAGTGGILVSAADARFSIDGGSTETSQRNVIDLFDESVELTLTGTTEGEATTVSVQPDTSGIASAISDFVDAFNSVLDFALGNPGEISSPLALQLQSAIGAAGVSLGQIGISQSSSTGLLEIDTDELTSAIADGRFERVSAAFTGPAGLATVSQRVGEQFRQQPASYLTHPRTFVEVGALASIQRSESTGLLVDLLG